MWCWLAVIYKLFARADLLTHVQPMSVCFRLQVNTIQPELNDNLATVILAAFPYYRQKELPTTLHVQQR